MVDYDKAILFNPRFIQALQNRGALSKEQGNFGQAMKDFDHAISTFDAGFTSKKSNRHQFEINHNTIHQLCLRGNQKQFDLVRWSPRAKAR